MENPDYLDNSSSSVKSSTNNDSDTTDNDNDQDNDPDNDNENEDDIDNENEADRENWKSNINLLDQREIVIDLDNKQTQDLLDIEGQQIENEDTFGDATASVPSTWAVSSGASWMAEKEIDHLLKSHQVTTCMEIENKLKLVKLNDERFKAEARKMTPTELALSTDSVLKVIFRKCGGKELKCARLVCRRWNLWATMEMRKKVRISFPKYSNEIEAGSL